MKVLNFGSLNLDYVYSVPHIVQPGETINSSGREVFTGGKGLNQSIAMARAGVDVYHAGCIGPDGDALVDMLRTEKVSTQYIRVVDVMSGHTIIQVNKEGQNCIIVYGGANREITKAQVDAAISDFDKGDILLLQNETNEIGYIMERAYEQGMRIFFNPSPYDPETIPKLPLHTVSVFVVNEIEGADLFEVNSVDEVIDKAVQTFPDSMVLLTMGEEGSRFYDGKAKYEQKIFPVKALDTTAAGDTFLGYFIYGVTKDEPMDVVLERAAAASAIAVSRNGAAPSIPTLKEVEEWLNK